MIENDICPDCGSPMMEVCSGLEKDSRESCGTQIDMLLKALQIAQNYMPVGAEIYDSSVRNHVDQVNEVVNRFTGK